jgi:putative transposase
VKTICGALGVSRATYYRCLKPKISTPFNDLTAHQKRRSFRTITGEEGNKIMEVLYSQRFVDKAPAVIVATLLDEGQYLCSTRTMYRLLSAKDEVRERRAIARARKHKKPELLATHRNQVWSWDITKLKGPGKWNYFYLYVIMDIFSRKIVGWGVYERELALLAENLIAESIEREGVDANQLTLHSDRGAPMKSKAVSELLSDLSVSKSFSRPHVSNDNPFSEAAFKTLKYVPEFPERFGCLQDARVFGRKFFQWYNHEHKHSGISYFTPDDVHSGRHVQLKMVRDATLKNAWEKNPERFVKGMPKARSAPDTVWINKPMEVQQCSNG